VAPPSGKRPLQIRSKETFADNLRSSSADASKFGLHCLRYARRSIRSFRQEPEHEPESPSFPVRGLFNWSRKIPLLSVSFSGGQKRGRSFIQFACCGFLLCCRVNWQNLNCLSAPNCFPFTVVFLSTYRCTPVVYERNRPKSDAEIRPGDDRRTKADDDISRQNVGLSS